MLTRALLFPQETEESAILAIKREFDQFRHAIVKHEKTLIDAGKSLIISEPVYTLKNKNNKKALGSTYLNKIMVLEVAEQDDST